MGIRSELEAADDILEALVVRKNDDPEFFVASKKCLTEPDAVGFSASLILVSLTMLTRIVYRYPTPTCRDGWGTLEPSKTSISIQHLSTKH